MYWLQGDQPLPSALAALLAPHYNLLKLCPADLFHLTRAITNIFEIDEYPLGSFRTQVDNARFIFNRPDTTAQVFDAIRQARPPRLYVAADGPRPGHPGARPA